MQDSAKTQHWKQRENTYIHKQRLSAMCTCIHRHTRRQMYTHRRLLVKRKNKFLVSGL